MNGYGSDYSDHHRQRQQPNKHYQNPPTYPYQAQPTNSYFDEFSGPSNTTSRYNSFGEQAARHPQGIPYDSSPYQQNSQPHPTNYFVDSPHLVTKLPAGNRFVEEHHDDSRFTPYSEVSEFGYAQNTRRTQQSHSSEVNDLLSLYTSSYPNTPSSSQYHQGPSQPHQYRNPQNYYPYRQDPSVDAPEPSYQPQRQSRALDPLRASNRQHIQQPSVDRIESTLVYHPINPVQKQTNPQFEQSSYPHRSYSLPHHPHQQESYERPNPDHDRNFTKSPNYWHSIRPDINPLYDPQTAREFEKIYYQYHQKPYREERRIDTSILDNLLDPTADYSSYSDEEMAKSTSNWKNSFSAMREKFGTDPEFPLHEYPFATNGSLTLPRGGSQLGKVLAKSASQSAILGGGDNRLSLLKQAVDRRASEAPEFREPPQRQQQNQLMNFWTENVKTQTTKQTPQKLPFGMTAAERLQMLQEPVDSTNGGSSSDTGYSTSSGNSMTQQQSNLSGFDGVALRRLHYLKNALRDSESPSIERRSATPVGQPSYNGGPNFSKLDNAIAEMAGEVQKTTSSFPKPSQNNNGCARFPVDDSKYSSFTNKPVQNGHSNKPMQHSPSPEMLNENIAELPHPRPKHNIREQLMNAGVMTSGHGSTFYGPYPGRKQGSPAPMFPSPTSGKVSDRVSALERRPGTPNLLQIACALTSTPQEPRSPGPKSPLGLRETVFKTKPVIHVDYGGKTVTKSSLSPDYEENGSIFKFPEQGQHKVE